VNPALSVTTTSLAAGVIGTNYSQTLAQRAVSPLHVGSDHGSLPAGLSLNTSTGAISGTPSGTFTGTTSFAVTVTDNEIAHQEDRVSEFERQHQRANSEGDHDQSADGCDQQYLQRDAASIGSVQSYSWQVTAGSLPPGLSLSSTGCGSNVNCAIIGTPTTTGTYNFTVTVTDSETPTAQTASANLSIAVNKQRTACDYHTGTASRCCEYVLPERSIQANGGVQPYAWSISSGALPAGLS